MLVYKDIISGDEMVSDSFPLTTEYDGAVLVAKSSTIVVDESGIDIGANPSAEEGEEALEDGARRVNNIVDGFRLQETSFGKKDFMTYIKGYMKALKTHLEANNPDRVEGFMSSMQQFVKKVVGEFDEYSFYTGESMNPEGAVILAKWEGESPDPHFYYIKDGMKEEKL